MSWFNPSDVGLATRRQLAAIGHGARLFARLVLDFGACMRRFSLVRDQIHFLGNYSLAIIAVSGLFIGFVLGLQGFNILQRYGSSEALGQLVTLSLVREGLGWAYLPHSLVQAQIEAGTLVVIDFDNISNQQRMWVDVVWSKDRPLGLGAQRFIALMRDMAPSRRKRVRK